MAAGVLVVVAAAVAGYHLHRWVQQRLADNSLMR